MHGEGKVKTLANPSTIDLILANCPGTFQNTKVFERRHSDLHKCSQFKGNTFPNRNSKSFLIVTTGTCKMMILEQI